MRLKISKTVEKQTGGSRRNTLRRRKSIRVKPQKAINKCKRTISKHKAPKKEVGQLFLPE